MDKSYIQKSGAAVCVFCGSSFGTDPAFRDRLSARVGEHLKVLRRKITERGMVRAGVRLSDEVAVGALLENAIITTDDLDRINDPAWCSRQEDLWWTQPP